MKKLLINDTVRIEKKLAEPWVHWMQSIVLPLALKRGNIESYKLTKILGDEADDGISFACQYICRDSKSYSEFINNFDPEIQQEQVNRFGGHFGTFRSVLEILEEGNINTK